MLESTLERLFRQRVRAAGGLVVQLAPTTAGVPDRLVLHDGNLYLVELKADTGALSAVQEAWHHKAALRGVDVVVLRGKEDVLQWTGRL